MNTTTTLESPAARPLVLSQAQVSESWEATKLTMGDFRRRIRRKIKRIWTDNLTGVEHTSTFDPTDEQKENRARTIYRQVLGEDAREGTPVERLLWRIGLRVQLDAAQAIVERDLGIAQRRGAFRVVDDAAIEAEP